jgi:hypothetical protein
MSLQSIDSWDPLVFISTYNKFDNLVSIFRSIDPQSHPATPRSRFGQAHQPKGRQASHSIYVFRLDKEARYSHMPPPKLTSLTHTVCTKPSPWLVHLYAFVGLRSSIHLQSPSVARSCARHSCKAREHALRAAARTAEVTNAGRHSRAAERNRRLRERGVHAVPVRGHLPLHAWFRWQCEFPCRRWSAGGIQRSTFYMPAPSRSKKTDRSFP